MKRNLLVFLVFLLVTLVITWPLAIHLNTLIIDRYDSLLITWVINWLIHSLASGPAGWLNILNSNIFYPYQNTLAFSDYHFVSALLALPFVLIFQEPLIAFNINLILGFALTGFSGYLLARYLTGRDPIAFLAGALLTFSTIHLNYMAHPQIFHLWLLVFTLFFLFKSRFKLFILFFVLAVLNSPLNLYFLLFFVAVYIFIIWKDVRKIFYFLIVGGLISSVFLLPFFIESREFHYARPVTDAIHFSLQFPDLANVSVASRLSAFAPQVPGATPAYFGGIFFILLIIAFRGFIQKMANKFLKFFLLSSLFSFILSLGPALHIFKNTVHVGPLPAIPLPYVIFYYLVPGFSGFRTPSRWIVVTALSLCFAIAIYFSKKITWFWAIVLSLLVILEINFPFKYNQFPSVKEFPPEQVWLKDHFVGAPLIQFPIYAWFDGDKVGIETLREYYSTVHWHPMYNGYSGFSPKEWEEVIKWLQKEFPSAETIDFLRKKGIKLVLAPKDWSIKLKLVQSFPDTNIYAIN